MPTAVGDAIRLLVEDEATAARLVRSAVGRSLASDDLARDAGTGGAGCRLFEIRAEAAFPDGTAVASSDLISLWESRLKAATGEHRWLLEPLLRHELADERLHTGARTAGRRLELCTARPIPDLAARLRHPALWLLRRSTVTGYYEGPGAFAQAANRALAPNRHYSGSGPYIEGVEWEPIEGRDPGLLFDLEGVDAALLYGGGVAGLDRRIRVERLPAWDRVYFLWMRPRARWINDPTLRRWIAGRIDREQMIRYLFQGGASPAWSLLAGGPEEPTWDPVERRPLSAGSVPRLEMLYDEGDRQGQRIAQRIEAILEGSGFEVTAVARRPAEMRRRLSDGDVEMALLSHRPITADPVLSLRETLGRLPGAEAALGILERGADRPEPEQRDRSAEFAEQALLLDARLVPLVRLSAWLVTARRLSIPVRADGAPALELARWLDD